MKKALLLITLTFTLFTTGAQDLRVAYFGENLTHYGIRTGVEYRLNQGRNGESGAFRANQFLLGLSLSLYRHPQNHIGVILSPEFTYRRVGRGGGFVQLGASPGLFRSFLEGKTYRPNGDGGFERVPLAGRSGFMPSVSLGYGRDLSLRHDVPLSWFCNLHYLRQYPYNGAYLNRFALELGVIRKMR